MNGRGTGRSRSPAIPFLLCLGLGYAFYLEISAAPPTVDPVGNASLAPIEVAPLPPASGFTMPPLAAFPETTARPLFSMTRKPPPPEAEAPKPKPSPKPVGFRLTGIVISPEGRTALIQPLRSTQITELAQGQEIDGWLVESILPDRLVLRFGTIRKEMKIEDEVLPARSKPKPKTPPRRSRAPNSRLRRR